MLTRFTDEDLNTDFDVVIIGGGINGCGIARDAAERGLSVLLLEKEDFGYGCTSASTRLIHGGLRYLEYFEFGLVRESLRERELLLKNASHLVKPLEICIPIYKNNNRSLFEINAGMLLYDLLSFDKSLPSYKSLSRDAFHKYEPFISTDSLLGAVSYYDAQVTFPERICVENVIMAVNSSALILNHAEVVNFNFDSDRINQVSFLDKLSNKTFSVNCKQVVNVSGPWVDELCALSAKPLKRKIGGTKGTHIVLKNFTGSPLHAIYAPAKSDNRPFFILPWNDFVLVGTTDTYYDGDLDSVCASDSDISYLINETNNLLSDYKINKNDVLYTYSGVRPLPYVSSSTPGSVTRKHIIFNHKNEGIKNLTSIVGGKLTTFRSLSEEVVDSLFDLLELKKVKCRTRDVPLLGLPIPNLDNYNPKSEFAYTVSDVLLRRTTLGFSSDFGLDSLDLVISILKNTYGYSDQDIKLQVNDFMKVVNLRKI